MRSLALLATLCAIALSGAPVPPTAPAPKPPSPPANNASNPVLFQIPSSGTALSLVAVYQTPGGVVNQWNNINVVQLRQAWDNSSNSYSEVWYNKNQIHHTQKYSWINGTLSAFILKLPKQCYYNLTIPDNVTTLFFQGGWIEQPAYPSKYVGQVSDPFLGTTATFNLFSSPDTQDWMLINNKTGDLVYLQYWKATWGQVLVHYFPQGVLNTPKPTVYDYQIFEC